MVVLTQSVRKDILDRCSLGLARMLDIGLISGEYRYRVGTLTAYDLSVVVWLLSFVLLSCWEDGSPSGLYAEEEARVLKEMIDVEYINDNRDRFPPLVLELLWMFRQGGKTYPGFGPVDFPLDMEAPLDVMLMFGYWLADGEHVVHRVGRKVVTGPDYYWVPTPLASDTTASLSSSEDDVVAESEYPDSLDEDDEDKWYEPPDLKDEYSLPDLDSDGNLVESSVASGDDDDGW